MLVLLNVCYCGEQSGRVMSTYPCPSFLYHTLPLALSYQLEAGGTGVRGLTTGLATLP